MKLFPLPEQYQSNMEFIKKKWKLLVGIAVAGIILAVMLIPQGIKGEYKISACIYDGTNLTSYAKGSYLKVNGTDNNKANTLYVYFDGLSSTVSGYLDIVSKYSEYTKYKFTVTYNVGDFLGKMDYFYVFYYQVLGVFQTKTINLLLLVLFSRLGYLHLYPQ